MTYERFCYLVAAGLLLVLLCLIGVASGSWTLAFCFTLVSAVVAVGTVRLLWWVVGKITL